MKTEHELKLVLPSYEYADEIRSFRSDFLSAGSAMDGCGCLRRCDDPNEFIRLSLEDSDPDTLHDGHILSTQLLCIRQSDSRLVGAIQIRPDMHGNELLEKYIGNIGYCVRPRERRKGYAGQMLHLALEYCRALGLDEVILSCEPENIASERVILANGGIYESTVYWPERDINLKRYHIRLCAIKILDSYKDIEALCTVPAFDKKLWDSYIHALSPGIEELCRRDLNESLATGRVSFNNDYLPVLNAACANAEGRELAHASFLACVEGLESKINKIFGRCPNIDLVFYMGLCNGAGWAVTVNGQSSVLLGLEKILELNWYGIDSMRGLLFHELGHAYQEQFGIPEREPETSGDEFLWQLFTEGIAMYFEQSLYGSLEYFHQDANGWKDWCDKNFRLILSDFDASLETMRPENQCWFGDWVNYRGHSDVGYYLGCRFVQFAARSIEFDRLISLDISDVRKIWKDFLGK